MAYFSQDELKLQLSPAIYDRIFGAGSVTGFGEISATSGSLRFTQLAEQASGYVDAFLEPAGYAVPLASPSHFIKRAAMYRFIVDVYMIADIPVSDTMLEEVRRTESVLHDIATGKIPVPGLDPSTISAGAGGHIFTATTGSFGQQLGKGKLGGTFF